MPSLLPRCLECEIYCEWNYSVPRRTTHHTETVSDNFQATAIPVNHIFLKLF